MGGGVKENIYLESRVTYAEASKMRSLHLPSAVIDTNLIPGS